MYSKAACLEQKVVPGEKLCLACQKKVTELQQTSEEEKQNSGGSEVSESTSKEDDRAASSGLQQMAIATSSSTSVGSIQADVNRQEANQTLQILGQTPVKISMLYFLNSV